MQDILEEIIERKKNEIKELGAKICLKDELKKSTLSVIAEYKRQSPSRGKLSMDTDIVKQAFTYVEGGASAISILTDQKGFGGTLADLHTISSQLPHTLLLRKDFIISRLQLVQSLKHGATAVLLIVAVLGKQLHDLIQYATLLGLESLVEVHTVDEIKIALDAGAEIIGVNHRNLRTFEMDFSLSEKLVKYLPSNVVKVAESGIKSVEEARRMRELGYDAILVGEALMLASDPAELIRKFKSM